MFPSVLLVDKPKGLTSFQVVEDVKRRFKVKVGHTGTLDPIATGLLILLLGTATRYAEFFTKLPKEYLATAKLGEIRDTYDAEGTVVEKREVDITCQDIHRILKSFIGRISQAPPPYSAKRVEGRRAYELARKGLSVPLKPVEVEIFHAQMIECQIPQVRFLFCVSSGTYIRSLVHDIGLRLGCGAYVEDLRRTKIGPFDVSKAISYERLMTLTDLQGIAIPIWSALDFMPAVDLDFKNADKIRKGMFITLPSYTKEKLFVRLYEGDTFIGVGVVEENRLKPYRLLPQK
ncbi:MAG: tRNA pseudouridine(55) synthase TruB [Hydrogenobacter sp.]